MITTFFGGGFGVVDAGLLGGGGELPSLKP